MTVGRLFGCGISFPPRLGDDGRWAWSEGEANIRDSIRVILETEQRERLMLPRFGGGLRSFLFEPNTVATRARMADRITRALGQWEPRIAVSEVAVDPDPRDTASAVATIRYKLVATGTAAQLAFTVTLGS